jgi:serine/threonine protein kinase
LGAYSFSLPIPDAYILFSEVHKAKHRPTGKLVALKRILMHNEKEGMPVTALREIKILKAIKHPNVVELLDMFVVRGALFVILSLVPCSSELGNGKDRPLSVYMVFPYMDHDLAGLLENDRVKLQPSQIKLYMKQLLEGTEYMHRVGFHLSSLPKHLTFPYLESHFTSRYEGSESLDLEQWLSTNCRLWSGTIVRS